VGNRIDHPAALAAAIVRTVVAAWQLTVAEDTEEPRADRYQAGSLINLVGYPGGHVDVVPATVDIPASEETGSGRRMLVFLAASLLIIMEYWY
jgi:hypothetical protein